MEQPYRRVKNHLTYDTHNEDVNEQKQLALRASYQHNDLGV